MMKTSIVVGGRIRDVMGIGCGGMENAATVRNFMRAILCFVQVQIKVEHLIL